MVYIYDRIFNIGSEISFMVNGRERIGIVKFISYEKDQYQTRLWYRVEDVETGEECLVDGETFRVILN